MRMLAIETATDGCSVALRSDGATIERSSTEPRVHAQRVLGMVEQCLAEASLKLADLDALAFGRGPGSFTGVRIAVGVVQGLAMGSGLPVVPVSTLAGHAVAAARVHGHRRVAVAVDARMGECYWGLYEVEDRVARACQEDLMAAPGDIPMPQGPMPQGERWSGVGSGWSAYPPLADSMPGVRVVDTALLPTAGDLVDTAIALFGRGEVVRAEDALPVYLRDKVAWRTA